MPALVDVSRQHFCCPDEGSARTRYIPLLKIEVARPAAVVKMHTLNSTSAMINNLHLQRPAIACEFFISDSAGGATVVVFDTFDTNGIWKDVGPT